MTHLFFNLMAGVANTVYYLLLLRGRHFSIKCYLLEGVGGGGGGGGAFTTYNATHTVC